MLSLGTKRAVWRAFVLCCLIGVEYALSGFAPATARRALRLEPPDATAAAAAKPKEEWLGTYIAGRKVGYQSEITTSTRFEGQPALRSESHDLMKLSLFGASVEERGTSVTITDLKYRPLSQVFDVASNGSAVHLEAAYDYRARVVHCVVGAGSARTRKDVAIPEGANLAADSMLLSAGQKLKVGLKLKFVVLEPLTVQFQPASFEVTGQAKVRDNLRGADVSAFVVHSTLLGLQMVSDMTADGDLLRAEILVGGLQMSMIPEPKKVALNPDSPFPGGDVPEHAVSVYSPPVDFAVATAVTADRTIAEPRRIRSLRVVLSGIPDKKFLLSDNRQKLSAPVLDAGGDSYSVSVAVTSAQFSAADSARLPVTEQGLQSYLGKAEYLNTEDAGIRAIAQDLRGNDTNLYNIATKIRNWVHAHMTPDPTIAVPRSATDILGRRRGVCRDYATLDAAIARAAGVPTRLCAGIVYSEGRFYYHAWVECYVGTWLAFDPTLYEPNSGSDFVDATHIKFAQGDVTEMFGVVGVIGKLHAAIGDFSGS